MEWTSGELSSRPGLPIQHKDYATSQGAVTARSRSPSRDRQAAGTDSGRRYRERSRSPSRRDSRARHDGTHHDGEDSRSHRSGRSRTSHPRHHRRHRDNESDRGRDREAGKARERGRLSNASRRDDDRREPSPATKTHDYWDDRDRDMTSRSGSRYSSNHHCIDSTLKQHHIGAGSISPVPTPPNPHTVRLPPPETERHYSSHRCHHHSHDHSPTRSTAPHSHSDHHRPRRRSSPPRWHAAAPKPVVLPYGARALSRWDFAAFEPLFAHHLEKHQQVRMADLDEKSVRDRWKGFVAKWNAGELDKGWYEPEMFLRVVRLRALEEARVRAAASVFVPASTRRDGDLSVVVTPPLTGASFASEMMESVVSGMTGYTGVSTVVDDEDPEEDDDDGYAPPMPPPAPPAAESSDGTSRPPATTKPGPTIPSIQDLELRRTLEVEAQEAHLSSLRLARHADRLEQKSRLDDLVPRAEAGTRERQLEKRRLTTEAMRDFAANREPGGEMEVGDPELLGAGADDYRRMLAGLRQRRTEREVRREEVVRARNAEREERVREARAREEERVGVLREMARRRFG